MSSATKFPLTRAELAESGAGLKRFPATFGEYWDVLEQAEYRADFHKNEIIGMSYETNAHSSLETEIQFLLRQFFSKDQFQVHSSNRPIYVAGCEGHAVFNPDCSVVIRNSPRFTYKAGLDAETQPFLIVEILSKTTADYDFDEKLPCYKKIPSLRHILYIDSRRVFVSHFARIDQSNSWLNTDFDQPAQAFQIEAHAIRLMDLYAGVF